MKIRIIILLSIIVTIISLTIRKNEVKKFSDLAFCNTFSLKDNFLHAKCKIEKEYKFVDSILDLNACVGVNNGVLMWAANGNYSKEVKSCMLNSHDLHNIVFVCRIFKASEVLQDSSVKLNVMIINDGGKMVCKNNKSGMSTSKTVSKATLKINTEKDTENESPLKAKVTSPVATKVFNHFTSKVISPVIDKPTDLVPSKVTGTDSCKVTSTDSSKVTSTDSSKVTSTDSSKVTSTDISKVLNPVTTEVTITESSKVIKPATTKVSSTESSKVTSTNSSELSDFTKVSGAAKIPTDNSIYESPPLPINVTAESFLNPSSTNIAEIPKKQKKCKPQGLEAVLNGLKK